MLVHTPSMARPVLLTTMHPEHLCKPSKLHQASAHEADKAAVVKCLECGRIWVPTKRHHGPGGRTCGCGWECVNAPEGVTADGS